MKKTGLSVVLLSLFVLLLVVAEAYCASSKACFLQGDRYFSRKKYDLAVNKYKEAIKINPKVARYYYKLAE
ncbi:MAG: tetratricopeptide repeat protein, partial [Thermodesulfobacteriota bacterium]|nr:tetratricopeptide repeat protein [Thermodesulfobacteriota bacterium]